MSNTKMTHVGFSKCNKRTNLAAAFDAVGLKVSAVLAASALYSRATILHLLRHFPSLYRQSYTSLKSILFSNPLAPLSANSSITPILLSLFSSSTAASWSIESSFSGLTSG